MAGHRPFRELTRALSPARRARVENKAAALETALVLGELRKALAVSQREVARKLDVGQPAVAKLERRADMFVSNLRRYVQALGGELHIAARFPEGSVTLDVEDAATGRKPARG